ncbi:hypothetical protein Leryth_008482 [Lithospermum erythrorhizon]|nr:hypothetical protein Leryth_008482 [Lithospermum erythrorhizon]
MAYRLRLLDLVNSQVSNDEEDWISCFHENTTCLEYLEFDCMEVPTNFEALEMMVMR